MAISKIIDPSIAANAYSKGAKTGGMGGASEEGISFSDFLKKTAADSIETMKSSETLSAKAVTGEADLADVVQAVTAAELTLQTVVAVRDRMLTAYQEIMRMPI